MRRKLKEERLERIMAEDQQNAAAGGVRRRPAGMTEQEYTDLRRTLREDIIRDQQTRGRLKLELPTFSGAKSPLEAQAFLRDAEGYREACGLDEAQLIQAVQFALRDEAKTWGSNLALTANLTTTAWGDYRRLFENRFGLTMSPSEKAKLTESLTQKAEESVRSFFDRCQSAELVLLAGNAVYQARNNDDQKAMREQGICEKFLRGLREAGDLKGYVNSLAPRTGQQAITLMEYYEAAIQKEQTLTDRRRAGNICEIENEPGEEAAIAEIQKRELAKSRCFRCGKVGHFKRDCRVRVDQQRQAGRGFNPRFAGRGGGSWTPTRGSSNSWRRGPRFGGNNVSALEMIRQAADALLDEETTGSMEDSNLKEEHFQ